MNWIEQHAVLMSVVVWPLLTALVSGLFKPRTPEAYAELPPRLAAFLKLVGALGLDVPNVIEAVKQGVANKSKSATAYRAGRSSPLPSEAVTLPALPADDTPVPSTKPEPRT